MNRTLSYHGQCYTSIRVDAFSTYLVTHNTGFDDNKECGKNLHIVNLNMAYNRLSTLPLYSFICIEYIEQIDLSFNKLSHLNILSFESCEHLSIILLQGNQLVEFIADISDREISYLQLKCLRLDDNKLTNAVFLNYFIRSTSNTIMTVNLTNNNIKNLSDIEVFANPYKNDIFQDLCWCEERSGYFKGNTTLGHTYINVNIFYTINNCILRFRSLYGNHCPNLDDMCILHSFNNVDKKCRRHGVG